jgi:4-alpha-glucanotransferase
MAVLQFGFTPSERGTQHVFARHVENQIVYTGTHDNDTIRAWFEALPPDSRALLDEELSRQGISDPEPHWAIIRLAFASPARVAMVQAQDVLGLGPEGRMNQPGLEGGWGWRLASMPSNDLAKRLREATEESSRLGSG